MGIPRLMEPALHCSESANPSPELFFREHAACASTKKRNEDRFFQQEDAPAKQPLLLRFYLPLNEGRWIGLRFVAGNVQIIGTQQSLSICVMERREQEKTQSL
jgi:hypothetical protein